MSTLLLNVTAAAERPLTQT